MNILPDILLIKLNEMLERNTTLFLKGENIWGSPLLPDQQDIPQLWMSLISW